MRLCDRDIEARLDEGRLSINPRPPVERINGATVDVRTGNKFRTFRGHTAAFIDLSGPKDEVSAALDRVMSDEIVLDEARRSIFTGRAGAGGDAGVGDAASRSGGLAGRAFLTGASGADGARHRAPHRSGLVWLHCAGVLQLR